VVTIIAVNKAEDARVEVRSLPPEVHAWVGDAVFELYVRTMLAAGTEAAPRVLHDRAVARVRAEAQAAALERLWPGLAGEELVVVKRARNVHGLGSHRGDPAVVHMSTAFEALLGYLYLSGQWSRLTELLRLAWEST